MTFFRRKPKPCEVGRIRVNPGDVVIAQFSEDPTMAQVEAVRAQLASLFPDNSVGVLDGVTLLVYGPKDLARAS